MSNASASPKTIHEPWYKYGVAVLLLETAIAIAVSGYSLFMTFHGLSGLPGNCSCRILPAMQESQDAARLPKVRGAAERK